MTTPALKSHNKSNMKRHYEPQEIPHRSVVKLPIVEMGSLLSTVFRLRPNPKSPLFLQMPPSFLEKLSCVRYFNEAHFFVIYVTYKSKYNLQYDIKDLNFLLCLIERTTI